MVNFNLLQPVDILWPWVHFAPIEKPEGSKVFPSREGRRSYLESLFYGPVLSGFHILSDYMGATGKSSLPLNHTPNAAVHPYLGASICLM
jgi:hypothetical protein